MIEMETRAELLPGSMLVTTSTFVNICCQQEGKFYFQENNNQDVDYSS